MTGDARPPCLCGHAPDAHTFGRCRACLCRRYRQGRKLPATYRFAGWLWRIPGHPWAFRATLAGRTFPPDAEFRRVYEADQ